MNEIRFGTDGVRGRAGEWPLTEVGARAIGLGVAALAAGSQGSGRVVIGRDTRESGPWLTQALCQGLVEGGAHALDGGVLPTAAISCAVVAAGADAGLVITASHNPWHDNGIKVLGPDGGKHPREDELEALFGRAPTPGGGSVALLPDPTGPWLAAMPRVDLSGARILLDCAFGAAALHAPGVLRERGAHLVLRGVPAPGEALDGRRINDGVGAMHPPSAAQVVSAGCDLAICLDGDADRVVMVDPQRGIIDGDDVLWLVAGSGAGPVVGTIMSNGGLEAALAGRLVRAPVGDRHLAAAMVEHGAAIGAEPSGHVLFVDGLPTGDGLYTALRVLAAVTGPDGRPRLPLPLGAWTRWPQVMKNLRIGQQRPSLDTLTSLREVRAAGHRSVVRFSGTEPLVRVMVEGTGSGDDGPEAWVDRILAEISSTAGTP